MPRGRKSLGPKPRKPRWSKKMNDDITRFREKLGFRMFMRQVVGHLGPFETGKLVTLAGYVPDVEKIYYEERDTYLLEKFRWQDIPTNGNGELVVNVPDVDDRIVKIESVQDNQESNNLPVPKQQRIINFVDLTDISNDE